MADVYYRWRRIHVKEPLTSRDNGDLYFDAIRVMVIKLDSDFWICIRIPREKIGEMPLTEGKTEGQALTRMRKFLKEKYQSD